VAFLENMNFKFKCYFKMTLIPLWHQKFLQIKKSIIDSVDKSAAKMNLTTSSANIIQGMTDEGEHLTLLF
jgi:hypothetical protein